MDTVNTEQNIQEPNPKKKRSCCFWGCLIPFVCLIILFLCVFDFHIIRSAYPVGLDEHEVTYSEYGTGITVSLDVINDWIKEEGKDQLFIGTWKVERSASVFGYLFNLGGLYWKKTRLEIRPDYTFILSAPPEGMDYLHGFRETVTGKWKTRFSELDHTLMIEFTHEIDLPADKGVTAYIRSLDLWTLRKNDTSDKYLRLQPFSPEGYFRENIPSWKKVIEKKQVQIIEEQPERDAANEKTD